MNELFDRRASARLVADFRAVIADTEALLKATVDNGTAEMRDLRAGLEKSLAGARTHLHEAQDDALARGREMVTETSVYLHAHPWRAIGLAAGIGLFLGWVSHRR